MTEASRTVLEEFIRRANEIQGRKYQQQVRKQNGTEMNIIWAKGLDTTVNHNFPDEEAIAALTLTARMFVQSNDPISFNNLRKLEADPEISERWKERLKEVHSGWKNFLKSPGIFKEGETTYTYEKIFNVYVYGGLAHTDKHLAPIYNRWRNNPQVSAITEFQFHQCITVLVSAVNSLAHYTKMELAGESDLPIPATEVIGGSQE